MKLSANKIRIAVISAIMLLVLASAGFVIYQRTAAGGEDVSAVVSVDGKTIRIIELSEDTPPYEIDLSELAGVNVVLEVQGHAVHFHSSDCPDQICVHTGWLRHDMDVALCMPNRVSVVVMPSSHVKR